MLNTAISVARFVGNVGKERFEDTGTMTASQVLVAVIFLALYILLILLLGKWLFNNVLCKLVPAVRPASSVWEVLGLMVLLHLLLP